MCLTLAEHLHIRRSYLLFEKKKIQFRHTSSEIVYQNYMKCGESEFELLGDKAIVHCLRPNRFWVLYIEDMRPP